MLRLGASGAFPDDASLSTGTTGTFDLNDLTETIGPIGLDFGTIDLGAGTLVVTQSGLGAEGGVFGPIVGSGNLVKAGPDRLRFSGNQENSYTGTTTITDGLLMMDKVSGTTVIRGNIVVSGGRLRLSASNQVDDTSAITVNKPGVLSMDGGRQETIRSVFGTGTITLDADARLTFGDTSGWMFFAGTLTGAGTFRKQGLGTLVLAGHSVLTDGTATGAIEMASGRLLVDGSVSGGSITVGSGRLGGTGRVSAIVAAPQGGAIVSPGNGPDPGILTADSVEFAPNTSFAVKLNGTTPGTGYDRLTVASYAVLFGATLNATLGFVPAPGDTFTIIEHTGGETLGTFKGLPDGAVAIIGGLPFRISYHGGNGFDVVLTALLSMGSPCSEAGAPCD